MVFHINRFMYTCTYGYGKLKTVIEHTFGNCSILLIKVSQIEDEKLTIGLK